MIAYLVICYALMAFWCVYALIVDGDAKSLFKLWVLSPVTLPIGLVCKFLIW